MAIRKHLAKPIGSLTQMGTIRLGKRTEARAPKINEFVPLAGLDDIVFGGWDIFEANCYEAARTAGVLEPAQLDQVKGELEAVKPMPAVFDQRYVKRLDGPNVKKGKNKRDLAEQLIADIRAFKADNGCDRLVMLWVGSTEVFMKEGPVHQTLAAFEKGLEASDDTIPSSMVYAYAAHPRGPAVCQRRAQPHGRHPGAAGTGRPDQVAACRQRHEDRPDADQDHHRAGVEGAPDWREGVVFHQHPGQPRRRGAGRSRVVQDQGREQEVGARLHLPAAPLPRPLRRPDPRRAHQLLPAAWGQQGRLGQHST